MSSTISRVGKYELKAVLARTTLSTVYDGWDADIARRVAIKLMPIRAVDDEEARESLARFKRGAQAAGRLSHPNIVAVFDYGETADYAYIVMEYIDGPTLKALFDENRRMTIPEIASMVGSILDALQYSHDRRIVHRDIKPANVMFTKNNEVKVTDFGIARLEDSDMTQAGMVIGTPAYMSPEQFLGENVDWRTDIYSSGVLLYHVLTGQRPYEGTLATIMHKVLFGAPMLPSQLSTQVTPELDKVVTRAMAKKREDRFQSATEFKTELLKALASHAAKTDRLVVPPPRVVRNAVRGSSDTAFKLGLLAAAIAVVLGCGGGLAWYLRSGPAALPVAGDKTDVTREASAAPPPVAPVPAPDSHTAAATNNTTVKTEVADTPAANVVPATPSLDNQAAVSAAPRDDTIPRPPPVPYETKRADSSAAGSPAVGATNDFATVRPPRPPQPESGFDKKPYPLDAPTKGFLSEKPQPGGGAARQPPRADNRNNKPVAEPAARSDTERGAPGGKPDSSAADTLHRLRLGMAEPPPAAAESPSPAPSSYPVTSSSLVGLLCQSITAETAATHGLDNPRGMVVQGVTTGSAAAKAGLHADDVILEMNGSEIRNLSALGKLAQETAPGQTIPVKILRHGSQQVLQLQLDALRKGT
jgi:predicted Ser/Thr protein kinase